MPSGHVFVVRGDLNRLASDDVVRSTGDRIPRELPLKSVRALPLLTVPVPDSGEAVAEALPRLRDAAAAGGFDVAWVAGDGPTFAAAQAARCDQADGLWPGLDRDLRRAAIDLAARANR